jgi:copper homeostasis protein
MLLEVCVDEIPGLDAAVEGGADRVEICAALPLGGLTPCHSLLAAAVAAPVTAHALIRPRPGGFVYTEREAAAVAEDIDAAIRAGVDGVVIGASAADRTLDGPLLRHWIMQARETAEAVRRPVSLTLHRAFDCCPDLFDALDQAIALGFDTILTSGGMTKAPAAADMLGQLHAHAAGRITILAGSGIDATNVDRLLSVGVRHIHGSCSSAIDVAAAVESTAAFRLGFGDTGRRRTDPLSVSALRNRMSGFFGGAIE